MPVTVQEISRASGFSIGTCSRALTGRGSCLPSTRDKIKSIAKELGYVPNRHAEALRSQRSRIIGLMTPSIESQYYNEMIPEAVSYAHNLGYEVIIYDLVWFDEARQEKAVRECLRLRCDGVVFVVPTSIHSRSAFDLLIENGIPAVSCTEYDAESPGLSQIYVDTSRSAELAFEHLLELGHRDVMIMGFDPGSASGQEVAKCPHRAAGVQRVLRRCTDEVRLRSLPVQNDSLEAGSLAMRQWLDRGEDLPTAVLAVNDEVAAGGLFAMQSHGIRVPQDVSLVGCDNTKLSRHLCPPMTTIDHAALGLLRRAMERIHHFATEGFEPGSVPPPEAHQPELVVRASTAAPRTSAFALDSRRSVSGVTDSDAPGRN